MSDVQPASDKEIAWWRDTLAAFPGGLLMVDCDAGDRLLARLDAATARIAELEREKAIGVERVIDAKIRAETAERKLKAAREAISMALRCTPSVRDGEIIYDCGDPWQILRAALALIDKTETSDD